MGLWSNTTYVACDDQNKILTALEQVAAESGRTPVLPKPRTPDRYDPMQYGKADEVLRWGFAVFPGAPGWCVIKSAPLEVLSFGQPCQLSRLTQTLDCDGFAHHVYDGDSSVLVEANATGETAVSGFCGADPARFHGQNPKPSVATVRFRLIEVSEAVSRARGLELPPLHGIVTERQDALREWLDDVGGTLHEPPGDLGFEMFSVPAADAVAALATPDPVTLGCEAEHMAISAVFAGVRAAEVTDNMVSVGFLVAHSPLPYARVKTLYVEKT